MELMEITVNWERIVGILGALALIDTFLKNWFGVSVLGKKIFKGAPAIWKWMMRRAIFRKEMQNFMVSVLDELRKINAELNYNGGSSTKDQVRLTKELVIQLINRVRFNEIRLDVSDILNKRMTAIMNKDGEVVAVNDVFLTTFNYAEEDILQASFESIIAEKDLNRLQTKWARAVSTKSRFYEQLTMYNKAGETFEVCMRGFPDVDEKGELHKEYYVTFEIINQ